MAHCLTAATLPTSISHVPASYRAPPTLLLLSASQMHSHMHICSQSFSLLCRGAVALLTDLLCVGLWAMGYLYGLLCSDHMLQRGDEVTCGHT